MLIKSQGWNSYDQKREYAVFMAELHPHMVKAVERSFLVAKMMVPTAKEVKRRCDIAIKLIKEMRFGHKWSRPRIRDNLSDYLSLKLMGLEVDLTRADRRGSW